MGYGTAIGLPGLGEIATTLFSSGAGETAAPVIADAAAPVVADAAGSLATGTTAADLGVGASGANADIASTLSQVPSASIASSAAVPESVAPLAESASSSLASGGLNGATSYGYSGAPDVQSLTSSLSPADAAPTPSTDFSGAPNVSSTPTPSVDSSFGSTPGTSVDPLNDPNAPAVNPSSDPYANETQKFAEQQAAAPTSVQTGVPPTENSSVNSALKQLGAIGDPALKYGLPIASLGMNAMAQKKARTAEQQLQSLAKPASDTSNNLLNQFGKGQISAADSYAINQQQQQDIAAAKQYYANAGLSNSSMELESIQNIQNNAENQRQEALNNMLTEGLTAAGTSYGPQMAAVQAGVQSDQQLQQATASFMQMLARMNAQSTTPQQQTDTTTNSSGS